MAEVPITAPITNLCEARSVFLCGLIGELELIALVDAYLDANPDLYSDGDLAEIICLDRKTDESVKLASSLLDAYLARTYPNFDAERDASVRMGKAFLKQLLERYLRNEFGPREICRYVPLIEQAFNYPAWFGGLWNVCDCWGDYEDVARDIYKEAERVVATL